MDSERLVEPKYRVLGKKDLAAIQVVPRHAKEAVVNGKAQRAVPI